VKVKPPPSLRMKPAALAESNPFAPRNAGFALPAHEPGRLLAFCQIRLDRRP